MFSTFVRYLSYLKLGNDVDGIWVTLLTLSVGLIVVYFLKYLTLIGLIIYTNSKLHNNVYSHLLSAKMSFFEETDRADVMLKFSNDINVMDVSLPFIFCDAIESPLYFLNLIVVIGMSIHFWLISVPFMMAIIWILYKVCTPIMQKVKLL